MARHSFPIYIISDAIGETGQRIVHAALAQFPDLPQSVVKRYPFISQESELDPILKLAAKEDALLVTTIVDPKLNHYVTTYCQENKLDYLDYMTNALQLLEKKSQLAPRYQSGAIHDLDRDYFNRIAAIEFAVKYDDGKSSKGFMAADLVILGVSRTSKTPLSMYLANKSYKVANLPLIPEVPLSKALYQVDSKRLFGLTASPEYIAHIRYNRIKLMGLDPGSRYANLERIRQELSYAEEVYHRLHAQVINVEDRSIEETAQIIEQAYQN